VRPFREVVSERTLVLDGAMGTELHARGFPFTVRYEELNLSHPDVIAEIHEAYVRAGADVVETNTFGAARLEGPVDKICASAVALARGSGAYVAGAIGPLGRPDEDRFREVAEALAGGDLLIVETMRHPDELAAAVRAAKSTGLFVVALASFTEENLMADGTTPETIAKRLVDLGADLVGANCSEDLLDVATRMKAGAVVPSAGLPGNYRTPEAFAVDAARYFALGARLVGGCCGTTPAHIEALRRRRR
jgi:methionine synthase I (cobalamin-dependent)